MDNKQFDFLIKNLYLFISAILIILPLSLNAVEGVDMDVKCTVYEHSGDDNGDNVDVRILVMGLKNNTAYTAKVIPDHNPSTSITTKTDSEGIFWAVARVPNGENSLLFKVTIYEDKGTTKNLIAAGEDDAPCYGIPSLTNN